MFLYLFSFNPCHNETIFFAGGSYSAKENNRFYQSLHHPHSKLSKQIFLCLWGKTRASFKQNSEFGNYSKFIGNKGKSYTSHANDNERIEVNIWVHVDQ